MKIVKTISIYKEDGYENYYGTPNYGSPYIQVNDVSYNEDGEAVLEAGRPLTFEEAERIFKNINKGESSNKPYLLPRNILMWHKDSNVKGYRCIFYKKAKVRPFYHVDLEKTLYVPWPTLIFFVTQSEISVYAVKNKKNRPEKSTKLYHAPFFNTYNNGRVCMGNFRIKRHDTPEEAILYWSYFMFNTKFTGELGDIYNNKNLLNFWKNLDGKEKFPNDILEPTNKKLKDLL